MRIVQAPAGLELALGNMNGEFDGDAMIERFKKRAEAVKKRGIPPVEGPERRNFIEQSKLDYMDFAIIGDAKWELDNGMLSLTIDLSPPKS